MFLDYAAVIESPLGNLGIEIKKDHLTGIFFIPDVTKPALPKSPLAKEISRQLRAYFNKQLFTFDLPYLLACSDFAQKVLTEVCKIPVADTATYLSIARVVGTSPRAVGNACRINPLPIIVPCHRVVSKQSPTSPDRCFKIRKWLIDHERNACLQK